MTNKLEQDKKIIADAPDAKDCVVDVAVNTKKSELMYIKRNARGDKVYRKGKGWNYLQGTLGTHWVIRSLDDIRENIALQERIADLESQCEDYRQNIKSCNKHNREMLNSKKEKDAEIVELEEELSNYIGHSL